MCAESKPREEMCFCHSVIFCSHFLIHIFLPSSGLAFFPQISRACPDPSWKACSGGELWACRTVSILALFGVHGSSKYLLCLHFSPKPVNYSLQALRPLCMRCMLTSGLYVLLLDSLTAPVSAMSNCKVKVLHCGRQSTEKKNPHKSEWISPQTLVHLISLLATPL